MKTEHKILTISLFIGLSVWIIDTVLDVLFFYKGTFLDLLILKIPQHELYIRCVILGFFFMFGLLMSRVISKRRKIEESLRTTEKRLSGFIKAATEGIMLYDSKLNLIEINEKALEIFPKGTNKEELLGKNILKISHSLEKTGRYKQYLEVIKTGNPLYFYDLIPTPNFGDRYFSLKAFKVNEGLGFTFTDITKRKKAEEELKASESKYRSLFSNMLNGFAYCKIVLDDKNQPVDFIYLEINEAFEKLTGLKKKDVLNKRVTEAIPGIKEATPELFDIYGKVALTGKGTSIILDFTPLDIWLDISVYSPQKGYFVAVFENITERKKAEKILQQYEQIVSCSTDMMGLLDNQFKYLAANKTYLDAFNLTSEKLVGLTVSEVFGEEFFKTIIKPNAEQCLQGKRVNYQVWFEFPTLGKRHMDVTYSPYIGEDNEVKGFVVNGRDITERWKADQELKKYQKELITIFNSNPVAIWYKDKDNRILRVNKAGADAVGLKEEDIVGKPVKDLFPKADSDHYFEDDLEVMKSGNPKLNIVERMETASGDKRWVNTDKVPYYDEKGDLAGIIAFVRDITERKKAEEQLEKSQKELKKLTTHLQTVREEERTLVAHELHDDIGQALSALKMDIFMLEKKLPKDQKDISDQIKETNDLLDKTIQTTRKIYSELRPTLIEYFSIEEVLEDQLNTFLELTGISGESEIDLGGTELDEKYSIALYRIVQEALNNIKWHSQAKTVKIRLKKKKNQIELMIKDNGIGIKEDDLTKSNAYGILGMKERSSFLGGEIEFKGLPNKGTTVTVTFPFNPESLGTGRSND